MVLTNRTAVLPYTYILALCFFFAWILLYIKSIQTDKDILVTQFVWNRPLPLLFSSFPARVPLKLKKTSQKCFPVAHMQPLHTRTHTHTHICTHTLWPLTSDLRLWSLVRGHKLHNSATHLAQARGEWMHVYISIKTQLGGSGKSKRADLRSWVKVENTDTKT